MDWRAILAERLEVPAQQLNLKLLAAGVNNAVYQLSWQTPTGSRQLVLRVPAQGKELMSYGPISSTQIKSRIKLFAQSQHCPQLLEVDLPAGAVLCEFVAGRAACFPDDLPLIMQALAALHTSGLTELTKSTGSLRAAALTHDNHISYPRMLQVISERSRYLEHLSLPAAALKLIKELLKQCTAAPAAAISAYENSTATAITPILKDANPGNFIISAESAGTPQAIVVDVEGAFYGMPVIDVGHASLFSACLWEYPQLEPLPATTLRQLYEGYFAQLTDKLGASLAACRPPAAVLYSLRGATLGRCLTWMSSLLYLAEHEKLETTPAKLQRAKLILSEENLIKARHSEQQLRKLL